MIDPSVITVAYIVLAAFGLMGLWNVSNE